MSEEKREITFEIQKEFGAIQEESKGWRKELNLVSWNGNPAKYDIRSWSDGHQKMDRGITLKAEEAKALRDLLGGIDFDEVH